MEFNLTTIHMLLKRWVTLFFLIILGFNAQASHIAGLDLYYQCLGNNKYRIWFKGYRDCNGMDFNSPPTGITINSSCGNPTALTDWIPYASTHPITGDTLFYADVTPICQRNGVTTTCDNPAGSVPGRKEVIYYRDYDFTGKNCAITFSYSNCCRNSAIQNISNPDLFGLGIRITIKNSITPCNSSPYFTERPIPFFCKGQTSTLNMGAIDPDGDSLRFRLGNCLDDYYANIPFAAPYTVTNPFPSSPAMSIDPLTGTITITPTVPFTGIMCIYVDEYRNGVLIGTIERDMQITVLDCQNLLGTNIIQTLPVIVGVDGVPGVFADTVCAGGTFNFFLPGTDADGDSVKIKFSVNPNLHGATYNNNDAMWLPVANATFSWTATAPGQYPLVATIQDNHCPLNGSNQYAIKLLVLPELKANKNISSTCNTGNFSVTATGGLPPYTYLWSGPDGLNFNSNRTHATFNHNFSGPGSYPISVTVTDSFGCSVTLFDTLTINGIYIDAGIDISLCADAATPTIGSASVAGYTYAWTPTIGLDNPQMSNPRVTLQNNGTAPITQMYTVTVSQGPCSVTDSVLVVVYPKPVASITASAPQICVGDSVTLTGVVGMSGYLWNTGDTTQSIVVKPTATTNYSLMVTSNTSCISNPTNIQVTVLQHPVGKLMASDTLICYNGTASIVGINAPSFTWSTGVVAQSIQLANITTDTTIWAVPSNGLCTGDTLKKTFHIIPAPVVQFSHGAPQCLLGNNFSFTATGTSGANITYQWNFGAQAVPQVSDQKTAQVRYTTSGTKIITLTAFNNGCIGATYTDTVIVLAMPEANFDAPVPQCFAGHSFDFTNRSTITNGVSASYFWDFGANATPTTSLAKDPQNVKFGTPGLYPISLYVVQAGCTSKVVTKDIRVYPTPDAPIVKGDTICENYSGVAEVKNPDPALTMEWYTAANGGTPFFIGTIFQTPKLTRTTTYYIGTLNSDGCRSTTRTPVKIIVNNAPRVHITASHTELELPYAIVELHPNSDPDVIRWAWTFGDGDSSFVSDPVHQYNNEGDYRVTLSVVDSFGCINSDVSSLLIKVVKNARLLIPNAFSPNGDGINDKYKIHSRLITQFRILVFDRLGQLVFESNDANFEWDGTYNGKTLPGGVYSYKINCLDFDGIPFEQGGVITLIR